MPIDLLAVADSLAACPGRLYLAYSGGIDSQVLLHLCASNRELRPRLTAAHVHHGLQSQADAWELHCRQQADALDVAFYSVRVDARAAGGQSPEAAAREARYQALGALIQSGDALLVAQHREDQLETLLLQLFRGAGVQGLAAMPASAAFGKGRLLRPLLDVGKAEIRQYAARHQLRWVEDPSNADTDFDRNYLRNAILPLLKNRWPALDKTVSRSARHCAESQQLLSHYSQALLTALSDPRDHSLDLDGLRGLSDAEQSWTLRAWMRALRLQMPSEAVLNTLKSQFLAANGDPSLHFQGHRIRRYRQRLYCLEDRKFRPAEQQVWPQSAERISLSNGYALTLTPTDSGISRQLWQAGQVELKPRQGGERLKLPGRHGHHCLKKLYQAAGIPPWERDSRPLLYIDGRLAGVPGLWIDEWAWTLAENACYRIDCRHEDLAPALLRQGE
ncbi:tRNA lysidine(34) synthetase TilS [Methylomonas sp. HYX-M1]|uniref:tRNA lysidine(34) synthetase TilS n=1 Tax=Methylomonas sp. HYX-M1 TaxID=3139307 RepID=UPI00345C1FC9